MIPTWICTGLYLLIYTLLHSLLASSFVKTRAAQTLGPAMAFYRLAYVVLSLILLIPLFLLPLPQGTFYRLGPPYLWILHLIQAAGILGFLWSLRAIDLPEFLGIAQVRRHRRGVSLTGPLDEDPKLIVAGPYQICRHPLYFFASLTLLAQPHVTASYTLLSGWTILYFWIGTHFEERRLLLQFGETYRQYSAHTPRLLPVPRPR